MPLFVKNKTQNLNRFLKKKLGIKPKKIDFYNLAFIHKSATITSDSGESINNERLEFLGDSILNSIVSDYLYRKYKDFDEGKLTQTRSKLVNTNQLSFFNQQLGINIFLKTNKNNFLNEKHLFADSLEAFIGALFLDKGFKKTYKFVETKILNSINVDEIINIETNHKSKLIELSQKENFQVQYITDLNSKDNLLFMSKILINNVEFAYGLGNTKKEAEQNASFNALQEINPQYNNGKKNYLN